MLQLIRVQPGDKQNIKAFIQFPFDLYKNSPYWVPPIHGEVESILDGNQHPFYKHSKAAFFIICEGRQVLGRIAILKNQLYNEYHKSQVAFFYFFDCVENLQVSKQLLDAAVEWASDQGATEIYGPRGFSRSSCAGLLVEGFDHLPAMGISYNYPYYDRLLSEYGFTKVTDYYSGYADKDIQFSNRVEMVVEKVKKRGNFEIINFTSKKDMKKWVPILDPVHHEAFKNNPGYYPSTPEEFEALAKNLIAIAEPKLVKLIKKQDEIVGFILAYPNISRALQKCKGKLFPFGWYYLLREKRTSKMGDINSVGLLPSAQGVGANYFLYDELARTLRDYGFDRVEFIQIDERNYRSKCDMENLGVTWYKRHRTYRLQINKGGVDAQ